MQQPADWSNEWKMELSDWWQETVWEDAETLPPPPAHSETISGVILAQRQAAGGRTLYTVRYTVHTIAFWT